MNIYEQLLHTTLRIELLNKLGETIGMGTGFLVSVPENNGDTRIVLVSNRHVLLAEDRIAITFTTMTDGAPQYGDTVRLPLGNVRDNIAVHPNDDVDVAALVCTGLFNLFPDTLYFKAVDYDMLADFTEVELSVAENVLFVGYPDDRYDKANNLPLVRSGLIASDPKRDFNGLPEFVIDAQVFPGSSGSPVFIDLTYESAKSGRIILEGQRVIKALGLVAETMIRGNELQSVDVASVHYTEEVLGLGIVFKSTAIKTVIDEAIEKARQKEREQGKINAPYI